MTGFFRALKGEMRKLNKRRKYNVLFILLLIPYMIGRVVAAFTHMNAASGVVLGNTLLMFYLPLIAFVGVNDLISSEIKERSIQQCLIKPVSRMTVYIAKCAAVFLKCARHAFWLMLVDYAFGFIGIGSGSYFQILYLAFDMIPLFALIAFAALISVCVNSPAFSMLLTIVAYIAMIVAGSFLGVSQILFTSYMAWHSMLHGGISLIGYIERILAVVAPGVLFTVLGAIVLERKRF